jgi:hypothetical protein
MKTLVTLIAVLALTAPVFAGDITLGVDATTGTVQITAINGTPPVALGLIVDAAGGSTADSVVDVVAVDSFFDVYIDWYNANPDAIDDEDFSDDGGNSGADPDNAGPLTTGGVIALSQGELDDANDADDMALPIALAQIVLDGDGTGDICITPDPLRGGIVDVDGNPVTITNDGECFSIAPGCACRGDIADDLGTYPAPNTIVDFGDISALITQVVTGGGSITPVPNDLLCGDIADDLGVPVQGGNGVADFGDVSALISAVVAAGGSSPCLP